mgnify:CR=1 FL=1
MSTKVKRKTKKRTGDGTKRKYVLVNYIKKTQLVVNKSVLIC